jgi:hypothetical protein
MKSPKLTALTLVSFLLTANTTHAASTTGTASANVISGLSVFETTELRFGTFSSGSTPGTIDHNGYRTGGVTTSSGNGAQHGIFSFIGTPSVHITSILINGSINHTTVTLTNGASSMVAAIHTHNAATLNASGNASINVYGVLNVAANQAPGNYLGSYTITANY